MHTSGEKVRISDETERVQSVSYPHIRLFSVLYIQCYVFNANWRNWWNKYKDWLFKFRCIPAHTCKKISKN